MKSIRLIFIFLILLGGILGAFYLIGNNSDSNNPVISSSDLDDYRYEFESDWQNAGDWDPTIFKSHCDMVHQLSKDYDTDALSDLNTSTAVEIVYNKIFEKWGQRQCHKQDVDRYINALATIAKSDPNTESNPNAQMIHRVHEVYKEAYDFTYQKIYLPVHFDNMSGWNSFIAYANQKKRQKKHIEDSDIYNQYLSNISELKKGLSNFSSKLSSAKDTFYKSLQDYIIDYYSAIDTLERNRTQLNKLRTFVGTYLTEYEPSEKLNEFASRYAGNVNRNEKRKCKETSYAI